MDGDVAHGFFSFVLAGAPVAIKNFRLHGRSLPEISAAAAGRPFSVVGSEFVRWLDQRRGGGDITLCTWGALEGSEAATEAAAEGSEPATSRHRERQYNVLALELHRHGVCALGSEGAWPDDPLLISP